MGISNMKVQATMEQGFKTMINCSHPMIIDQPKAGGGTDEGANPLEFFLSSLAGCMCAIGRIIAMQKRLPLNGMHVEVTGSLDKDFLLGQTTEGRAGFTAIKVDVEIDADMSKAEKEDFVMQIEARCPVADNILNTSIIEPSVK